MMTQPFPAHAGMAPGHPGMAHHPMAGMQHPGGHMGGQPGPGMMHGMHPVSGPQVTQGPMVSGMPQGPGTPAPGGPMHNGAMAMAHLGPQPPMFTQHNPQMNFTAQTPMQQQLLARQRMIQLSQQQHQQQGMPMTMPNGGPGFNAQLAAQMKMNMPMQQQMNQMHANQQVHNFQQQQQHQQRMIHAQQAALAAQQNQAHQVRQAQAMQLSRSQEQPTTQPPPSQPTPTPQNQPQQPQSQPTPQPQTTPAQQKPQPQPQPANNQQQNQPNQQAKQNEPEEDAQIKQQESVNAMMMQEIPKQQDFNGQCILQLIQYQDSLANMERANDLEYWEETIRKYFSPFGSIRQQLLSNKQGDKSFQLQFPSLARFYHAHFVGGVKRILLQSYDHSQAKMPNGGMLIWSQNATLTYVFGNDIRIITTGSLKVNFDEMNKIEQLYISTSDWQEYIPRSSLMQPPSPDQKQSPKMNKNLKRVQGNKPNAPIIPSSGVGEYGVPQHIMQFLEIAEVMTAMGPLMEYFHNHPGLGPRDALFRINQENQMNFQNAANAANARMQNQMARAANGQMPFPQQMPPGMNGPNHFQSPGMAHLGLPQQGSPHLGGPVHTPSPAQNPGAGGVAMMHQMSAQGSNLSGSQGPSTNTSPNVSNKRRRPSAIKMEEEGAGQEANNANKVKPSPRMGGKRQKGAP